MPTALLVTLIAVLLALTASLVPLFLQLRQTIRTLERFLDATSKDLAQITEDVHASRVRLEKLAEGLQTTTDQLKGFSGILQEARWALRSTLERFQTGLQSTPPSPTGRWWDHALGMVKMFRAFQGHRHAAGRTASGPDLDGTDHRTDGTGRETNGSSRWWQ